MSQETQPISVFTRSVGLAIFLLVCASGPGVSRAVGEPLAVQLAKQAPQILKALRDRGCSRIGVLKFRVHKLAEGRVTDNAGTLNLLIAERLEAALVLANPDDPATQLQIARKASAIADGVDGGSHLSSAGRQALHAQNYPAAWGANELDLDALLTGVVEIAHDLKSMRIGVISSIRGEPHLVALTRFVADTDGVILNELGESFHVRSADIDPTVEPQWAELAKKTRDDPANRFPLQDKPSVALRVAYDGEPVELRFTDTEATIPEPREGERVSFEIERMDAGDRALGVVLKVNGENTLYRQRRADPDCAMWVLAQQNGKTTIDAFQKRGSTEVGEAFQVASREDSEALAMDYGPDVGTISMTVFQEAVETAPYLDPAEAPDVLAIADARFPDEPAKSLALLKQRLRAPKTASKGVILSGETISQRIRLGSFRWERKPVMSVVIRYYRP